MQTVNLNKTYAPTAQDDSSVEKPKYDASKIGKAEVVRYCEPLVVHMETREERFDLSS